jgi:hypothetical protein
MMMTARVLFAGVLLASTAYDASADAITIKATGEGWCNGEGTCNSTNSSTINNTFAGSHSFEYRNWFAFSLPSGLTIGSGTLNIWNDAQNFTTVSDATFGLRHANEITFDGLLGGITLGSISVAAADAGDSHFVPIPLNTDAIRLLNAADRNSLFLFGGVVNPISTLEVQIFGYTGGVPVAFLDLTGTTPEPATYLLVASALAAVAFSRRKLRTRGIIP